MPELTQQQLKELLHYDPETGEFTWLKYRSFAAKIGDKAGCVDSSVGYIKIGLYNKSYHAHRLAWFYMTGEWPEQIDHINHIRDDNRWTNLRAVTRTENQRNMELSSRNSSGISGVIWLNKKETWVVFIGIKGKAVYLATIKDFFEACCIRKSAELKHGYHPNHGGVK